LSGSAECPLLARRVPHAHARGTRLLERRHSAPAEGPGLTPPRLRRRCRALVDRLLPDAAEARITAAHTDRRVERFGDDAGQACLAVWGSPLDVQAMWLVIDRLAGPSDADDPRSLANRRFDATLGALLGADPKLRPSAELTDDGVAATPAPRVNPDPQLQLVVDLPTLAGLADHPGQLVGYGPIPAGTIRDWLTHATTWRRLVVDPVTGHLLDYGHRARFAPPRLDQYVRSRDQHCIFPGCTHHARTQLDHRPPWTGDPTGGATSAAHLAAVCQQHHQWITRNHWTYERLPDGGYRFTSPTGRTHTTRPPPQLPGP